MDVSNKTIRYRITGGEVQTASKSEWARLLRYLWINRDRQLTVLEMIIDLKSGEVPARLCQLQSSRFGILIDKELVPNSQKLRYRLSVEVEVIGEEADNV